MAACSFGGGAHWADPGARLVDGLWIGASILCPPGPSECTVVETAARKALPPEERMQVAQVERVSLPTHFVTAAAEPRTPRPGVGISQWEAVLVTLGDGSQRAVGLGCRLVYDGSGAFDDLDSECLPADLRDWQDGAEPPSFPPGTIFG